MSCLGPIKCEKPMETKKWEQEYCGRDSFSVMTFNFIGRIDIQLKDNVPEMCWLISMWCSKFDDQNSKDVDEEYKIGKDTNQAWCHVDPFNI